MFPPQTGCMSTRTHLFPTTMDMVYSAPIHIDPLLVIEIIDDAWASERLPVEDVVVAPSEMTNLEEDEPAVTQEEEDEDKWNDLGVDELASASTLPPYPPSESESTYTATTPQSTYTPR